MMQPVTPPPTPGDQVGPYQLQELLGVGGMATVYRGTDETGGTCAVKILHPGKAQTDEIKRFRREFLALKDLRHHGVVQVFEAGIHGDYPWIAMEYVNGSDLGTLIDSWTANPPADRFAQVERIFRGLCEGLVYIHEKGLIHRDLKPSNVLVTQDGEAKLTDFGVVKAPGAFTTQLTVAGKLVGTVAFMSPEQITGDPVSPQSDLYSLGAVLYVLLTLRRPIEADNIAGYLARHITETPRLPSELEPDVPLHLERICMDLLEKETGRRPTSAAEVLARIEGDETVARRVLHGREREIEWLDRRLQELESDAGGVVILLGPMGSGRTALLEHLVARAQATGVTVAATSGARTEVLGQLMRQLTDTEGGAATWEALIAASSGGPTVLVIDDLDHMDPSEIQGLTHMVRQKIAIEGMAVLLVASVESLTGDGTGLCTGTDTGISPERLDLGPLQRSAIIGIVRDQGVGGAVGAALGRRLSEELDGMPGEVVEQVSALVQFGWLVPTPDGGLRAGCTMEALRKEPLPLPERIRLQEAARIDALNSDSRQLFEVLVVLDMEATVDLIGEIAQMEPKELGRALQGLVDANFVRQRSEGVHEVASLRSDRNRDVAYGLIEKDRRGALHRAVAEALRRRSRRRSGTFAEVIATHLLSGGQVGEAYPMLLVAAETTLRSGQLRGARQLLDQADRARGAAESHLSDADQHRFRRRLFSLQGQVLHRIGDPDAALEAWRQALEAAREENDPESVARAQAGMGLARATMGDVLVATGGLEQALTQLPQGDPMWTEAGEALADARLAQGDLDGAERLWTELLSLGREMGQGVVHARAMAGLGLIALVHGHTDTGEDGLENAVFRMRDQTNRKLLPDALIRLAELAHADGRLEKAKDLAMEADAVAREIPRLRQCVQSLGLAAQNLFDLGVSNDALRLAKDSASLSRAQGMVRTIAEIASVLSTARVLVDLDALDDTQGLLPTSSPASGRDVLGIDDPVGGLLAIRSRIVLQRNPAVAVALARQVLDRADAYLPWSAARHLLDVTHTLIATEDSRADEALIRAATKVTGTRFRLLQLEAGMLAVKLGLAAEGLPDPADLLRALDDELGSPKGFRARWTVLSE